MLGKPDDLRIDVTTRRDGSLQLEARLQGRPVPLPLLTVTEADAQLHGLSRAQLASRWRELLQRLKVTLVALRDDHYAVGDVVDINGITGEVVDVGLLVTELRTADQRVVVVANSASQQLLNHTKIRSGVDVVIPLSTVNARLDEALALIEAECAIFAAIRPRALRCCSPLACAV